MKYKESYEEDRREYQNDNIITDYAFHCQLSWPEPWLLILNLFFCDPSAIEFYLHILSMC